jgi:hypothetical protein
VALEAGDPKVGEAEMAVARMVLLPGAGLGRDQEGVAVIRSDPLLPVGPVDDQAGVLVEPEAGQMDLPRKIGRSSVGQADRPHAIEASLAVQGVLRRVPMVMNWADSLRLPLRHPRIWKGMMADPPNLEPLICPI